MNLVGSSIIAVNNWAIIQVIAKKLKKLALILATSTPVIEVSKKDEVALAQVPYIYYPLCLLCFQKDNKNELQALIDSDSEVNEMTLVYKLKLGL